MHPHTHTCTRYNTPSYLPLFADVLPACFHAYIRLSSSFPCITFFAPSLCLSKKSEKVEPHVGRKRENGRGYGRPPGCSLFHHSQEHPRDLQTCVRTFCVAAISHCGGRSANPHLRLHMSRRKTPVGRCVFRTPSCLPVKKSTQPRRKPARQIVGHGRRSLLQG